MAMVSVACKLPNGVLVGSTPVRGYAKHVEERLHGGIVPTDLTTSPYVGGYAITDGVDEAEWDAWSKSRGDLDIIAKQLVFAERDPVECRLRARRLARSVSRHAPQAVPVVGPK